MTDYTKWQIEILESDECHSRLQMSHQVEEIFTFCLKQFMASLIFDGEGLQLSVFIVLECDFVIEVDWNNVFWVVGLIN